MKRSLLLCAAFGGAGMLSACIEIPTEPSVAVMPAPYKPMEVFRAEEATCRTYAQQDATGLANSNSYPSDYYLQYRYNLTYEQCMYSKGNQVPNFAAPAPSIPPPGTPPPQQYPSPPPAGTPPPAHP